MVKTRGKTGGREKPARAVKKDEPARAVKKDEPARAVKKAIPAKLPPEGTGVVLRLSKGEQARERVVTEALKVFAARGFADASFREIAEGAEIRQSGIFHYFDTKYALFEACVGRVAQNYQQIAKAKVRVEDGAGERLEKNLLANLEWIEVNSADVALLEFLYYTATHNPHFKTLYTGMLTQIRNRYSELIHAGVREGVFQPRIAPELAAELIHEVVLGTLINYVSSTERKNEIKTLLDKWTVVLAGVLGWSPRWKK